MASDTAGDAASSNLSLTPDEKRAYGQLFRQADTDGVGVVTGENAVKFFEKTRLDSAVLGEIWQIADRENRGFLTPAGFSIVLRLIGHAQAGREPTAELALQPGQLPRFDGFATAAPVAVPSLAAQPTATRTHSPLQAQGTGGGQVRLPPLTPEKVAQYTGLFERQSLLGGNMLPGDQAKQIFEKSGLPNEILGRIWQLADTEGRGSLVLTEFVIAMHLLTSLKTGALRGLPAMVPAVLYEAATRWGAAVAPRQHSPAAAAPAISAIPRQLSGQAHHLLRTGSPLGRAPLQAQTTGGDWLITPGDKARFDLLYEELDKAKRGFITGEEAVPFLSQSNLPEDALAQIWDLSDVNSEGRLTRDTFAVAMYLIRQQRSKRDGSITTLPSVLPPNLIPPSMRGHIQPLTATSMSPFDAPPPPPLLPPPQQRQQPAAVVAAPPPPPQPTSALDDLFGLDALTPPPPPPAASQASMQATGASAMSDPFASASPPRSSSPAKASPTAPSFKPFVPSSSFGRTLASHVTGDSNSSAPSVSRSAAPQLSSSAQDDLLGDNEAEASKKLTSDSTELANLSNQIGSLSRHMQEVQGQRTATQVELNQASAQKKNFEQRLSQLRALYEKEAKDVRALEEQLNSSRSETRKIQTEMAMLDATHQDLQNQHRQISTALQADRDENASLKERIRLVNAEIAQLKPQIEKLKSEARQQKGLVAINKKQLVTSGGERDKLKTEVDDLTRSNEELARQINSASSPGGTAGGGTQVASPVLSPSSGNNPFFKRTASTDIMGTFASPAPTKSFNDKSFDDVFGPAFPSTPNQAVNAFNAQHTGTSTASAGSFATPATSTPNVSPPVSRLGHVEPAATPEPPSNSNNTVVSSPAEAADVGQSMTSRSDGAKNAAAASSPTGTKPASNGGGSSPPAAGPAADAGPGHSHSDSLGSPFSVLDEAKAKEDFESAFASHKKARTKAPEDAGPEAPKALRAFDTEFPPITELEKHDESDSESDRAGFEDDFAPASPRPAENARTIQQAPPSPAKVEEPVGKSVEDPIDSENPTPTPAPAAPKVDDIFSPQAPSKQEAAAAPAAQAPAPTTASTTSKTPFDDLDDDFEGLEDAKEGSGDDDFATISRSGLDDFNPVFDSSPPSQVTKSESNLTSTSAPFDIKNSFDFASLDSSAGGSVVGLGGSTTLASQNGSALASVGKAAPASDGHDWDAIFATLDHPAPAAAAATAEASKPAEKPSLARIATEGEHDDPILKNLTSMGYSRSDALMALEKYDYNLERAANYLASQS